MLGRLRASVNAVGMPRRAIAWAAALAALAIGLDFVPLFDLLGFDFSFAVGLAAMLAGVDVGHGVVVALRRRAPLAALPSTPRLAMRAATIGLALLAPPLALSLANAARVRNCNLSAGFAFYALLPVGTMLFAAPAGVLAALVFPRRGRLVAFALPVGSLVWTLLRLYRDPAVFALDPFGGYFPGPIYDEALRPPERLLHFRLANFLWIGAAVAIVEAWRTRRRARVAAAGALTLAALVVFHQRGALGFHVRADDLRRALDGERRTEHFILRYARTARTPGDVDLDAADLEFRYQQLRRILGVEPDGPITVWDFPNAGAKKDLVGAALTLYAKPWTREVFVQAERFPSPRLRHELAHVFAAGFGDRFFGVALAWRFPLPRMASGLIEGLAEAADSSDPEGQTTVHQDARAIVDDGRAPPLATVVGAGFTTLSGARAYTLAGSFCAWLLQEFGAEKLRRIYASAGDFGTVYGMPLGELETRWKAFLATQPLPPLVRAAAHERFRRPAIFKKVCARELAARAAEARGLIHNDPPRAIALLEQTCRDDADEPIYRLDLAEAFANAGARGRALETAAAIEQAPDITDPVKARAATLTATLDYHGGDLAGARAAVERALALSADEGDRRTARVKLRILDDASARPTLGRLLFGDAPGKSPEPPVAVHLIEEFSRAHAGDPLGPYLLARQLMGPDPALALPLVEAACGGDAAARLPDEFPAECRRLRAEATFRTGDLAAARAAWTDIRDDGANPAERLRAADWLERIAWTGTRSGR